MYSKKLAVKLKQKYIIKKKQREVKHIWNFLKDYFWLFLQISIHLFQVI